MILKCYFMLKFIFLVVLTRFFYFLDNTVQINTLLKTKMFAMD